MQHSTWRRAASALLPRTTTRASNSALLRQHREQVRADLSRSFSAGNSLKVVKPFLLADIGEGIREVQIIQWFVQPGARVEQFDKLCEVQSDKASVEITSRFDGVIKKLHYEADDMATVGKPLVDIDIQGEISPADEALTQPPEEEQTSEAKDREALSSTAVQASAGSNAPPSAAVQPSKTNTRVTNENDSPDYSKPASARHPPSAQYGPKGTPSPLATPAVRHLTKELNVDVADIVGTGKDGRVLKEDVHNFVSARDSQSSISTDTMPKQPKSQTLEQDTTVKLTPIQAQMFKSMTRSLSIPHFLYTDHIDMGPLMQVRQMLNAAAAAAAAAASSSSSSSSSSFSSSNPSSARPKLSLLPFIVKAVSICLHEFPVLNARLEVPETGKPHLVYRAAHNIGVAVDTRQGLLVPVIKSVQTLSVAEIAAEIQRLGALGRDGKLSNADLSHGTFTVSNIGSIGGGVVSPVVIDSQMAILGIGRTKAVPAFGEDGQLIKKQECALSWSADHRVVDGATVAKCGEMLRGLLEVPSSMLINMR